MSSCRPAWRPMSWTPMGPRPQGKSRRDASRSAFSAFIRNSPRHFWLRRERRWPFGLTRLASPARAPWLRLPSEGRATPRCGRDRIVIACGAGQGMGMASNRTPTPSETPPIDRPYPSGPGVLLSAGDFAVLMDELDSLRAERRIERPPASLDGAELLTTLRTAGVEEARIEQVAAFIELASMVEDVVAVNGGAGIGSLVRGGDAAG